MMTTSAKTKKPKMVNEELSESWLTSKGDANAKQISLKRLIAKGWSEERAKKFLGIK